MSIKDDLVKQFTQDLLGGQKPECPKPIIEDKNSSRETALTSGQSPTKDVKQQLIDSFTQDLNPGKAEEIANKANIMPNLISLDEAFNKCINETHVPIDEAEDVKNDFAESIDEASKSVLSNLLKNIK